jgi:hypothetical protein
VTKNVIGFKAGESLGFLLGGVLDRASLFEDKHGDCERITLWYSDGHGVAIHSDMRDIADKLEVGVLTLERIQEEATSSSIAFPRPGTPRTISFTVPTTPTQVWKLKITEAGTTCESGLRIDLADAKELMILPSGRPCYLSIFIDNRLVTASVPEYDVTSYEQELVS